MARFVFGESLSPDELRRVHRESINLACVRPMDRVPTANDCQPCRFRFECAARRDNAIARHANEERIHGILAAACVEGDRCPGFPFCLHVRVDAMTESERAEWCDASEEDDA
jgi:hypothetical protein